MHADPRVMYRLPTTVVWFRVCSYIFFVRPSFVSVQRSFFSRAPARGCRLYRFVSRTTKSDATRAAIILYLFSCSPSTLDEGRNISYTWNEGIRAPETHGCRTRQYALVQNVTIRYLDIFRVLNNNRERTSRSGARARSPGPRASSIRARRRHVAVVRSALVTEWRATNRRGKKIRNKKKSRTG